MKIRTPSSWFPMVLAILAGVFTLLGDLSSRQVHALPAQTDLGNQGGGGSSPRSSGSTTTGSTNPSSSVPPTPMVQGPEQFGLGGGCLEGGTLIPIGGACSSELVKVSECMYTQSLCKGVGDTPQCAYADFPVDSGVVCRESTGGCQQPSRCDGTGTCVDFPPLECPADTECLKYSCPSAGGDSCIETKLAPVDCTYTESISPSPILCGLPYTVTVNVISPAKCGGASCPSSRTLMGPPCPPTPTYTPTETPTETPTATVTETQTPTETASQTPSPTVTETPPATPTETSTTTSSATPTASPTETSTGTVTETSTATATETPPATPTVTPSASPTTSPTVTETATATATRTPTPKGTCDCGYAAPAFSSTGTSFCTDVCKDVGTESSYYASPGYCVCRQMNVTECPGSAKGQQWVTIGTAPQSCKPGNTPTTTPTTTPTETATRTPTPTVTLTPTQPLCKPCTVNDPFKYGCEAGLVPRNAATGEDLSSATAELGVTCECNPECITVVPTATVTPTSTPTETETATATATTTPTPTPEQTDTATPSVTVTSSPTQTATPTDTETQTVTPTETTTPTGTSTPTRTATPSVTPTQEQNPRCINTLSGQQGVIEVSSSVSPVSSGGTSSPECAQATADLQSKVAPYQSQGYTVVYDPLFIDVGEEGSMTGPVNKIGVAPTVCIARACVYNSCPGGVMCNSQCCNGACINNTDGSQTCSQVFPTPKATAVVETGQGVSCPGDNPPPWTGVHNVTCGDTSTFEPSPTWTTSDCVAPLVSACQYFSEGFSIPLPGTPRGTLTPLTAGWYRLTAWPCATCMPNQCPGDTTQNVIYACTPGCGGVTAEPCGRCCTSAQDCADCAVENGNLCPLCAIAENF